MEYQVAFQHLCEDISRLLLDAPSQSAAATDAGIVATQAIAAALRRAAGRPADPVWAAAFGRLERFIELCTKPSTPAGDSALRELRAFVAENADAVAAPAYDRRRYASLTPSFDVMEQAHA